MSKYEIGSCIQTLVGGGPGKLEQALTSLHTIGLDFNMTEIMLLCALVITVAEIEYISLNLSE